MSDKAIFIGGGGDGYGLPQELLLGYANRHGLIAGATGTGKTVTLQIMAEGFSAAGVPVFLADVKGDLSGMGLPGSASHKLHDAFARRAQTIGWDLEYRDFPVTFWDIWGRSGHPIRATVAEMGPLLISRMLDLTEAQEGVLNIAFRIADEEGLPLLDFKDLTAILSFVSENAKTISTTWGLVSTSSVGAVQRRLLVLENQGGANLFGEPALNLSDLMLCDAHGRGRINMLNAERLMNSPRLYATFLLWLLSQLFEDLPEVGNPDKPKLVFFFDEAHLLFNGAPRALVEKVEQVARLIRSKGVGVYFITQNPADIPETVLGQLGNRVQHALRAFTGKDMRELKRAALNYRPNPRFSTEDALKDVGTGEALTSFLEEKGIPQMVERTLIRPPSSKLGPASEGERAALIAASPLAGKYEALIDRDSAHEMLARRAEAAALELQRSEDAARQQSDKEAFAREFQSARRYDPPTRRTTAPPPRKAPPRSGESIPELVTKTLVRQLGTRSGQQLVRGILGSLFKGR